MAGGRKENAADESDNNEQTQRLKNQYNNSGGSELEIVSPKLPGDRDKTIGLKKESTHIAS